MIINKVVLSNLSYIWRSKSCLVNPVNKTENVGIPRHAIGIKYMPFIDCEQTDGLRY